MNGIQVLAHVLIIILGSVCPGQAGESAMLPGVFIDAKDLTPAEMMQVRHLSREAGKTPWLIYGFRLGLGAKSTPRRTHLAIYLQPDVENGGLRRGRVLRVEIPARAGARRQVARIESVARYAHVVVLGRRPDEVYGKWDPYRPFLVEGELDDRTLFSLVALIRRSPEGPPLPTGEPTVRIDGSLPISRVRRTENEVEITLNRSDYQGEYVTLEMRNGRLVIVKHVIWAI